MNLAKFLFLLKAKGRHGTHSPFVYHFVEQVMRSKVRFANCPKSLSQKEWNRFNATIQYLQPKNIYLPENGNLEWARLVHSIYPSIAVSRLGANRFAILGSEIILAEANQLNELAARIDWVKKTNAQQTAIYLLHPHAAAIFSEVEKLVELLNFKMVLDCWDALLLVDNTDFKEKQLFRIR